jgi:cytochrome c oxidase subunit 3
MPAALKTRPHKEQYRVAPAKFNIWLLIVASSMLFAAVVSAFIVHQPDAQAKSLWTEFELPVYFTWSAVISLVSSIVIYIAWDAARKDNLGLNRIMLALSFFLGLMFCGSQYMGWQELIAQNLTFVNPRAEDISASYVWVITALHVLHVLGGIILMAVVFGRAMQFRVHKKEMTLMSVTHTYWHFVGLLWILLFLFLYFAR